MKKSKKNKTNAVPKKRTIAKATKPSKKKTALPKPMSPLKYMSWDAVELETLNPLFQRQFVVGENVMVARVLMKKGCIVPLHSHHNEQISYILEGALKFWIDGREITVNAGEVLTIPPNMPHKAEAMSDTVDLDIFNPPREDWMTGRDKYLREEEAKKAVVPHRVG